MTFLHRLFTRRAQPKKYPRFSFHFNCVTTLVPSFGSGANKTIRRDPNLLQRDKLAHCRRCECQCSRPQALRECPHLRARHVLIDVCYYPPHY